MAILLVEDDHQISEMVSGHLSKEGFQVVSAFNGEEAIQHFSNSEVELVILDLMLPESNGLDLLQTMRKTSMVPILIMSAKNSDVDKALGLGFGADDYLGKPFSLIELTARIKAMLRRSNQYSQSNEADQNTIIRIGDMVIDCERYTVFKKDKPIKLTAKEFQILRLLAANPNRVFTKGQLFESIWNEAYYGDENVINVHIRRIREKVETAPSSPTYIKTVWGIGYKLESPQ